MQLRQITGLVSSSLKVLVVLLPDGASFHAQTPGSFTRWGQGRLLQARDEWQESPEMEIKQKCC